MVSTIPFHSLQAESRFLSAEIEAAVLRVLASSQFILGAEVEALEESFAGYCQTRYAIGVNSGTSALHLALLAAGVGPGDEVITTPFTFYATTAAIEYCGALPVYVDIDPGTLNIAPAGIEAAITARTRAILPVHLYGQPADMTPILEIAHRHRLAVIEDAAQAHGAEYGGRRVGSMGQSGCFSFYPTKNLGAPGEGGMIVTSDSEIARTVRQLRDWGQERKYHPVLKGYNYRLQGLQAAVLRVKLRYLDEWNQRRRENAAIYDELLRESQLVLPQVAAAAQPVFHLYTVQSEERDALQKDLAAENIPAVVHYPAPIYLLPAYRTLRYGEGSCPVAEASARRVLSLPVHPFLSRSDIERVAAAARLNPISSR